MKANTVFKIYGIFILCGYFQACGYTCPGFDDKDLCWIPHNVGDKLRYTDGENILEFEVTDFYKTEETHSNQLAMDYVCDYEGYYSTNIVNSYRIKEHLSYQVANFGSWGNGMMVQFSDNDMFVFDVWTDLWEPTNMNIGNNETWFYPDTTIENQSFRNVFKVIKHNLKDNEKISWMIKVKDIGIVQFYDDKLNKTWTLIE
jgi:hypothetical protein